MARVLHFAAIDDLQPIAECIVQGGVVAFPTDTVYGVGASTDNEDALERIYRIKGRNFCKPLPVLVASKECVPKIGISLPPRFPDLVDSYWPGPLTLIIQARHSLSRCITADGSTVGIRMPDHPIALALLEMCGGQLATTSANLSGEQEARTFGELTPDLEVHLDWIIDGGPCGDQSPSTVLDLTQTPPLIRRLGPISKKQLEEQIGAIVVDQGQSAR